MTIIYTLFNFIHLKSCIYHSQGYTEDTDSFTDFDPQYICTPKIITGEGDLYVYNIVFLKFTNTHVIYLNKSNNRLLLESCSLNYCSNNDNGKSDDKEGFIYVKEAGVILRCLSSFSSHGSSVLYFESYNNSISIKHHIFDTSAIDNSCISGSILNRFCNVIDKNINVSHCKARYQGGYYTTGAMSIEFKYNLLHNTTADYFSCMHFGAYAQNTTPADVVCYCLIIKNTCPPDTYEPDKNIKAVFINANRITINKFQFIENTGTLLATFLQQYTFNVIDSYFSGNNPTLQTYKSVYIQRQIGYFPLSITQEQCLVDLECIIEEENQLITDSRIPPNMKLFRRR